MLDATQHPDPGDPMLGADATDIARLRERIAGAPSYASLALATADAYRAATYRRIAAAQQNAAEAIDAITTAITARDDAAAANTRVIADACDAFARDLRDIFAQYGPESAKGEGWQAAKTAMVYALQLVKTLSRDRAVAVALTRSAVATAKLTAAAAVADFERLAASVAITPAA